MTRAEILLEIEGEIARLVEVRRIMAESAKALKKIDAVTKKTVAAEKKRPQAKAGRKSAGKKRKLSAEGRRRIVLGQKRRWAREHAAQRQARKK